MPGAVQLADQAAGALQRIQQEDLRRRQARRQLATGLRIGLVAVGADGEALAGQPFDRAAALESAMRQDREVGERHAPRDRRFLFAARRIAHGDGAAIHFGELGAGGGQLAIDEAAALQRGGIEIGQARHRSHLLPLVVRVVERILGHHARDAPAALHLDVELLAAARRRLDARRRGRPPCSARASAQRR